MSELDLRRLFVNIRRESRSSVSVDDLTSDFHGCCIKAAVAKCIDFNITINRKRKTSEEAFVLLAGLRSICEDLIVLRYLATVSKPLRQGYLIAMLDLNREQSIAAQHAFFKANNPLQPVIGAGLTDDQIDARVAQVRERFRTAASRLGSARRDGPTVFDMAEQIGLRSTYRFMYFLASNFVHFTPQALMRMGWSGVETGPFTFNLRSMSPYYKVLASFYGAILFIGFYAGFQDVFSKQSSVAFKVAALEK